jgi:hypothetical protein
MSGNRKTTNSKKAKAEDSKKTSDSLPKPPTPELPVNDESALIDDVRTNLSDPFDSETQEQLSSTA